VSDRALAWLSVAARAAPMLARCARAQYVAFVLDVDGRIVGSGYNGAPPGAQHCPGGCPRAHTTDPRADYLDCVAVHAEANALLYSDATTRRGGTLVVNGTPCHGCCKLLASSGLRRVVYLRDIDRPGNEDGERLLQAAGVTVVGVAPAELENPPVVTLPPSVLAPPERTPPGSDCPCCGRYQDESHRPGCARGIVARDGTPRFGGA
jgi:dCMP deaminase